MSQQLPSIGRVVHYADYGRESTDFQPVCRAAIVTEVDEPGKAESDVGLYILEPARGWFTQHVPFGEGGGRWHWPERV
jgi:hypothetical protein